VQALDFFKDAVVIALSFDRFMSMTSPSNGLSIDHIVLAVCADEPDIDDQVGVVDLYNDAILLSAMLNTAQPSHP
jgi:hypothetical protein